MTPRGPAAAARLTAALATIVVLGLALRLTGLAERALWLDEVVSLEVAARPLGEILRGEVFDNHTPPLYYVLLHLWLRLVPETTAAVRLPSVMADLATVVLLGLATRRAFGLRAGLAAAATWAVAPYPVRLAQEARMYPLLMLLLVASFALALEADRRRDRWWPVATLAPIAAAALYTHYYAALSLLALHTAMAWRLRDDRPARRRWWGAMAVSGALFVPWLPVVADLLASGGQTFRTFGAAVLPHALFRFVVGFSLAPTTVTAKLDLGRAVLGHLPLLLATALAAATVLALGARRALADGAAGQLVVLLAAAPPAAAVAVALAVPSLGERYLAVAFPFVLLIGVLGVTGDHAPRWRPLQALAVALVLAGTVAQVRDPDAGTTPWRAASRELRRATPAGAAVVVRPGFYAPVLDRALADDRWCVVPVEASGSGGTEPLWLVDVVYLTRAEPTDLPEWTAAEHRLLSAGNGLRLTRLQRSPAPG